METLVQTVELCPPRAAVRVSGAFDSTATVVVVELMVALVREGCDQLSLEVGGVTTIAPEAVDALALAAASLDAVITMGSLSAPTRARLVLELTARYAPDAASVAVRATGARRPPLTSV